MNNKIIIFSFSFLLLISTMCFSQHQKIIKVGAFNYYPGIFQDTDGVVKGFYVDALNEIAKKENLEFQYVFGSWDEGLQRIKSGEVDLLTSVAFTEERSNYMDFCSEPLLTVWGELYTNNESELDTIMKVSGKKIGVMRNDYNAANFIDLTKKFGIECEFVQYNSFDEIFAALNKKVINAGVASVTYGAAKQKEFGLRATGVIFNPFNIYFTTAKDRNIELRQLLDKYLVLWKHDQNSVFNLARQKWSHGVVGYIEILPKWVSYVIYGLPIIISIGLAFIILLKFQVHRATLKIKEGEDKLKAIFEAANIGISITNSEGKYIMFNSWWLEKLGYAEEEMRLKTNLDITYKDDVAQSKACFQDIISKKINRYNIEKRFVTKTGSVFWGDLSVSAIKDFNNNVTTIIGIVADITEKKSITEKNEALIKEKDILLQEAYHRIKNNMSAIIGLISIQMESEKSDLTKKAIWEIKGRIETIMSLYERLNCNKNYKELLIANYLSPLVHDIVATFSRNRLVEIDIRIPDIIMNIQILTPLGIIVNELITNIMKYAFIEQEECLIIVELKKQDNHFTLIVSDNGIGIPQDVDFTKSNGFGLNIIRLLSEQIGGSVRIERNKGTQIMLEFDI